MNADNQLAPRIGVTGLHTYSKQSYKFQLYCDHVRHAGGIPVLLGTNHHQLPKRISGLLLAGGEDVDPAYYAEERHPTHRGNRRRDLSEFDLANEALAVGMPIFAICRGSQLLNVALGGSLVQDIPSQMSHPLQHERGARHAISIAAGSRLAELVGSTTAEVNSYHHQAVARLAPGLIVNAKAPDGTVEAWEPAPDSTLKGYVMAVQWHPERTPFNDPVTAPLFRDFLDAATAFARGSG